VAGKEIRVLIVKVRIQTGRVEITITNGDQTVVVIIPK
jgi:hypothetical protein